MALAPGRARRPEAWLPAAGDEPAPQPGPVPGCPFCEGHEKLTPPETWALRPSGGEPDTAGWRVRSVPNKFPVLTPADDSNANGEDPLGQGRGEPTLLASMPATGIHEVVVHTPEHLTTLAELSREQFALALAGWRARLLEHSQAAWVHIMVNEGKSAGASLEHSHSQLYALPFVPAVAARERERFTAHNTRTMGSCLLCDLLKEEVRLDERVVAVDEHAVLIVPYASRTPYELQLIPREHARSFADAEPSAAVLLHEGIQRLKAALGTSPPFNLWLRTAARDAEHFHWRIDLVPRLTQLAGFELGAGIAVNVVLPEQAAVDLREAAAAPEARPR